MSNDASPETIRLSPEIFFNTIKNKRDVPNDGVRRNSLQICAKVPSVSDGKNITRVRDIFIYFLRTVYCKKDSFACSKELLILSFINN